MRNKYVTVRPIRLHILTGNSPLITHNPYRSGITDTPEQALPQKNVIYIYVKQANNRHIIISGFRASLMFITKKKNVFSASFHKLCHHCLT